jgi:putative phosphoesterase
MIVGVVSDTHGLLRRQALTALHGASLIVHAGDVGRPEILAELEQIAPVAAVRGNVDRGPWAEALPRTRVVETAHHLLYVLHDLAELDLDPAVAGFAQAAGCAAVISGHSHRPSLTWRRGVLYLNPGSIGPRRFGLPVSLARLTLGEGLPRAELIALDV